MITGLFVGAVAVVLLLASAHQERHTAQQSEEQQ